MTTDESIDVKQEGEEEQEPTSSTGEEGEKKRKRKRKRKRNKESTDNNDDDDDKDDGKERKKDDASNALSAVDDKKSREVDRTIYIEGIPFDSKEASVREFFTKHGIDESSLEDVRLPVWQDSGRLRGYGHIVLDTADNYQKALALSGEYLGRRYVTIQAAQKPKQAAFGRTPVDPNANPSRTLILNNLSYHATEEDVYEVMEKYGSIADGGVRVVRHSSTGRSKGFGYVEYKNQEDAIAAMKDAQNIVIQSRPCRMDYDHGRVRGSFRTADRKLWHKEYNNNNNNSHIAN